DENKQEMIIVEQAEELSEEPIISDFNEIAGNDANAPTTERSDKNERNGNNNQSNDGNENGESQVAIDFTQVTNESYQLPPLELLKKPVHNNQNQEKKLISIN